MCNLVILILLGMMENWMEICFWDSPHPPSLKLILSDTSFPFKMQRWQFHIKLAIAITRRQGQTLFNVGLYRQEQMFTHRQLYVSMSKVRSFENLKIQICLTEKNKKSNCSTAWRSKSKGKSVKAFDNQRRQNKTTEGNWVAEWTTSSY